MTETSRELRELEHSTSQRCLLARSAKARTRRVRMVLFTLLCGVRCAFAQTGPGVLLFPLDPYSPLVKQVGVSKEQYAFPRAVHLKSQTGVTPAQSAIAKPTAAAPVDQRQSLYVERLKRGDGSSEVFAYLKGLRKQEITALLEMSSRYNKEDQRFRQTLVATLIDRHGVSDQNLEGLSDAIVLAVGDYYRDQPDQRCVKLYEGLLAKRKTKSDGYIPELEALAQYYQKIGDAAKAAETFLRGEQYTTDKPLLANFTVGAAREYMQLGDEKKANELYECVEKYGYGWATGMAIYDRSTRLIAEGKHDEARKLLNASVTGRYAEQIKVALLEGLAYSYYRAGDFALAERFSQEAVMQYDSLVSPLQGERLEVAVSGAKACLSWISTWRRTPLLAEVEQIELIPERINGTGKASFILKSLKEIPLTFGFEPPGVGATVEETKTLAFYVQYRIVLKTDQSISSNGFHGRLIITSPRYPQSRLDIPLHFQPRLRLRWSTRNVFLGFVKPGNSREVVVSVNSEKPFRILSVSSNAKWIGVVATARSTAFLAWEIKIEALRNPQDIGGPLEGEVRVETDMPGEEVMELPCYGYVGKE